MLRRGVLVQTLRTDLRVSTRIAAACDVGDVFVLPNHDVALGALHDVFDVLGLVTRTNQKQHRVPPDMLVLLGVHLDDVLAGVVPAFAHEPVDSTGRG